jgi:alcohol dehydrogenase (cytochrome c)
MVHADSTDPAPRTPDLATRLRRQQETAALGDAITELAARIQAATYELLAMIHQFDERGAYSPDTNTMYFALRNTCASQMATDDGTLYELASRRQIAPGTDQLGTVRAISVETGETLWLYEQRAATSALVATGGGLIFGGDLNGRFRAFDQTSGEVLWEINLGSPLTGFPITYAVDGRQYVAVSTGTAATPSGMMRLTPELRPSTGNNIFVFALSDQAR